MNIKKTYLLLTILLMFAINSCVKRTYISEEVIYSVEDSSNTIIDSQDGNKPSQNALFTDEQKLLASIIDFSIKYIGSPYKLGGTSPSGFDCSGFVYFLFNSYDIKIPRMPSDMVKISDKIEYKNIRPGDLVYFKGSNINSMDIGHVALVVAITDKGFKMIHSTSSKGVLINDLEQYDYWKTRYLFATRFKKETLGLK